MITNIENPLFTSTLIRLEPVVIVSSFVDSLAFSLSSEFPNDEFSFLATGTYTQAGFRVDEPVYIPEQEVSTVKVEYGEELEALPYNTVIHKHPSGIKGFSMTDEEHINTHFTCSLLYCNNSFSDARLKFKPEDNVVVVCPAKIMVMRGLMDIGRYTEKIKIKPIVTTPSTHIVYPIYNSVEEGDAEDYTGTLWWYLEEWEEYEKTGMTDGEIAEILERTYRLDHATVEKVQKLRKKERKSKKVKR